MVIDVWDCIIIIWYLCFRPYRSAFVIRINCICGGQRLVDAMIPRVSTAANIPLDFEDRFPVHGVDFHTSFILTPFFDDFGLCQFLFSF